MTDDIKPGPVTVWVMPHDDDDVRWVINTRDDMEGNFADLLEEATGSVAIHVPGACDSVTYHPADVFAAVDPDAYKIELARYCEGWTRMEIPFEVYFAADDNAARDWVTAHIEN